MHTITEEQLADVGAAYLGPEGLLARELPGYEARRPQIEMCDLAAEVIGAGGHAMIEAGTGTGKSLAYLIPAILSGKRVVVSTDTIQLQEQLVGKDLPFLARLLEPALGRPVNFAIAKGRANYFCERNASDLVKSDRTGQDFGALAAAQALALFEAWRWDGDKASLKLPVRDSHWGAISGDESCTGKSCEHARDCAYLAAKQRYEDADIVVTNHTMYLLHHYVLDRTGGVTGILPEHPVWVADEAHTLSDKCVDVFGVEIPHTRPAAYLRRVARQAKRLKLNLDEQDFDPRPVAEAADAFFQWFHGAVKQEQLLSEFPEEVVAGAADAMQLLVERLKPIRLALHWAAQDIDRDDKERLAAVARLHDGANLMIESLLSIFAAPEPPPAGDTDEAGQPEIPQPDTHVVYAEVSGSEMAGREVTLHRKPIETRPIFLRILDRLETALYTSATLAHGYGERAFRAVADELGFTKGEYRVLQLDSPFDYARQVRGYVPPTLPESRAPEYHTALAEEVVKILNHTSGRAFVLFTSIRDMRKVHELVARRVRFPVLLQGEAPKDLLVEQFKSTPNSVLMGVKTFWQGIDIPGDALSCVVLTKLPFPQPEHPLNKARCALIEKRGGSGFRDFSLPRCVRDVRQGFGRLIRTQTDTGVFAILDPRMRTARYGRTIADALPNFPCKSKLDECQ